MVMAALSIIERFDYGALSHIILFFSEYRFRPDTDVKATLAALRRYKASASDDGTVHVTYRRLRHNHGRRFAVRGLSLQSMPREIRNAVGFRIYEDLDFQNCHPSLLAQLCIQEGLGSLCPLLTEYVADRDAVLCGLVSETPGAAKAAVLAVINGGAAESPLRGIDMERSSRASWLRNFEAEMVAVRSAIVALPKGAPYLELARKSADSKKSANSNKSAVNILGSAINHMVCDLEDAALMALREFLEQVHGRKVGVLVFDGCMVERITAEECIPRCLLDEASEYIAKATGYRLVITVKDMATDKLDVPREAYSAWNPSAISTSKHADLVDGLRKLGGPLGRLPETCVFNKVKEGVKFMVAAAADESAIDGGEGVSDSTACQENDQKEALLYRDSSRVFTADEDAPSYLGAYCGKFDVAASLGNIHKDIPPDVDRYTCTVHEKVSVFANEDGRVKVSLYNAQGSRPEDGRIELAVQGKASTSVTAVSRVKSLLAVHSKFIEKELRRRLGVDSQQLFSLVHTNNGTININMLDPDAGRHTDEQLITAVISANPSLLERYRFAPDAKVGNCNGLYVCDAATNVWAQRHNVEIEESLVAMFADVDMSAADRRHVESRRGGNDMIHKLAGKVVDNSKLDANPDLFAVDNGVFDMARVGGDANGCEGGRFRPIAPTDWVGTTAGWSYDPEMAKEHRADVESFLSQVLPVPEEREAVLSYFAGLLSGRRIVRKFMVFTDRRAGANGKSTLAYLMTSFFGAYAKSSTKFVCSGSLERDRDSHGGGTEPFRGKRLVVSEELKHSMTLDVALLKKLTGGTSACVEDRRIGVGECFKFEWQAGFLLIFNEGDCPAFDAADAAFLERMIVAPMRSKFVDTEAMPDGGVSTDNTFIADPLLASKFPYWMPALADILLERFAIGTPIVVPPSMKEWKSSISSCDNPVADWVDRCLVVTGDRGDYLLMERIKTLFLASGINCAVPKKKVTGFLKAYLNTIDGVQVKDDDKVKYDGAWKTVYIVRGVTFKQQPDLQQ